MSAKQIAQQIIECFRSGHKILVAGNGGSAAEATHLVGEFIGKFNYNRIPLPAISLFDLSSLTAIANDFGYENVFVRPLQALGRVGDILITLSTSGKSSNVNYAIQVAKSKGVQVLEWPRKGKDVGDIQNYQLKLMHDVVEEVEKEFE